ncbi:DUF6702 family protein [Thalassotalea sp. PLHSN55]|uniref:DUF6702 family protein n=1 Tax=Thalassotalea sp. PLHSN55 TaxID=3435888 RepID=UPI003F84D3FC
MLCELQVNEKTQHLEIIHQITLHDITHAVANKTRNSFQLLIAKMKKTFKNMSNNTLIYMTKVIS